MNAGVVLVLSCLGSVSPEVVASRFLTGVAAEGAAVGPRVDVMSSADLRAVLDLEAQKQLAACDASDSCMGEIAAALDARVVVTASLSSFASGLHLQVAAYDARAATSIGRTTFKADSVEQLADPLREATTGFVTTYSQRIPAEERFRVLVLDVDTAGAASALRFKDQPSPSLGMVTGFGLAGLGAVGGGVTVVLLMIADGANKSVPDATPAEKQRLIGETQNTLMWAGVVALSSLALVATGTMLALMAGTQE